MIEEDLFKATYRRFYTMVVGKEFTPGNIILAVGLAVQCAQVAKHNKRLLSNQRKKELVMQMINKLVDEIDCSADDKANLKDVFIPTLLGPTIDSLCALNVQKLVKSGLRLFCCLPQKRESDE